MYHPVPTEEQYEFFTSLVPRMTRTDVVHFLCQEALALKIERQADVKRGYKMLSKAELGAYEALNLLAATMSEVNEEFFGTDTFNDQQLRSFAEEKMHWRFDWYGRVFLDRFSWFNTNEYFREHHDLCTYAFRAAQAADEMWRVSAHHMDLPYVSIFDSSAKPL